MALMTHSGFMTGFFVALRSDIPLALSEHIQKIRADPGLHCPNFCKKLVVDPAGEWHRSNKFFMHHMVKLGTEMDDEGFFVEIDSDKTVDVNNPPSQSDKRLVSSAAKYVYGLVRTLSASQRNDSGVSRS
jgi:hypothetical protein